ncbi:MAG: hypothetical protein HFJ08_04760 [Lachnospiraceae bacterium]|nr:hypothetical protein [Lachnospiraceae bacterium]MCX4378178.1 hypothetical protein [Lachnospiraceae bacterium]
MHTPTQRKYAIVWRIGGAQVGKKNLLYSIFALRFLTGNSLCGNTENILF